MRNLLFLGLMQELEARELVDEKWTWLVDFKLGISRENMQTD